MPTEITIDFKEGWVWGDVRCFVCTQHHAEQYENNGYKPGDYMYYDFVTCTMDGPDSWRAVYGQKIGSCGRAPQYMSTDTLGRMVPKWWTEVPAPK